MVQNLKMIVPLIDWQPKEPPPTQLQQRKVTIHQSNWFLVTSRVSSSDDGKTDPKRTQEEEVRKLFFFSLSLSLLSRFAVTCQNLGWFNGLAIPGLSFHAYQIYQSMEMDHTHKHHLVPELAPDSLEKSKEKEKVLAFTSLNLVFLPSEVCCCCCCL